MTLPPVDDSVSLSSFGGEGWGEEAVTPGGTCCPWLPQRLCPSPQPSPRAPLAGRGRNTRWQCQNAPSPSGRSLRIPSDRRSAPSPREGRAGRGLGRGVRAVAAWWDAPLPNLLPTPLSLGAGIPFNRHNSMDKIHPLIPSAWPAMADEIGWPESSAATGV